MERERPQLRRVGNAIVNLSAEKKRISGMAKNYPLTKAPKQLSTEAPPLIPYDSRPVTSSPSFYKQEVQPLRRRSPSPPQAKAQEYDSDDGYSLSSSSKAEKLFHELVDRIGCLQEELSEEREKNKAMEKILTSKDKRVAQLEDNDTFWREGFARQGKELNRIEKQLAVNNKAIERKDKEIAEITEIRLKEFDERVKIRAEYEIAKRKLSAYEKMHEEQKSSSSSPDAQASTSLKPIAEDGAPAVSKRASIREFNRRVCIVVKEKEEKISSLVGEKKKVLGKRLSLDSLSGGVRAATGSVRKKVLQKRMSLSQIDTGRNSATPTESKQPRARNVLRKKYSFEPSGVDCRGSVSGSTTPVPPSSSKKGVNKRMSFDNMGERLRGAPGTIRRGATKILSGVPRVS